MEGKTEAPSGREDEVTGEEWAEVGSKIAAHFYQEWDKAHGEGAAEEEVEEAKCQFRNFIGEDEFRKACGE